MKRSRWGFGVLVVLGVLLTAGHAAFAADTDSLIVSETGNVGIGTTTPQYKLEVNGTIKASNFIVNQSGFVGVGTTNPLNSIHVHNPAASFTNSNTGQDTNTDGFRVGLMSTSDGAVFVGEDTALR